MPRLNHSPNQYFQKIYKYKEFEQYVRSFAEGKFNSLIMIGDPGIGKSESIKRAIDSKSVFYCNGGQITPIEFYKDCFIHLNKPIILDDANIIMKTDVGRHIIMSLTNTVEEKTLDYRSSTKILGDTPTSFTTKSKVCYMANSWVPNSPQAEALEDRSQLVWFMPSPREIHLSVADWFWDQEIYDYVGSMLPFFDKLSYRVYNKAYDQKKAGLDWHKLIVSFCYNTNKKIVADLEKDSGYSSVDKKVARFCELTGLSRPTYFNYKKELLGKEQLDNKPLPAHLKIQGAVPA